MAAGQIETANDFEVRINFLQGLHHWNYPSQGKTLKIEE